MTSPRERAQQSAQLRQQQQSLVRDLLPVLDALDRAEIHWRKVLAKQVAAKPGRRTLPGGLPNLLTQLRRWLGGGKGEQAERERARALASSAGEGISLIRTSLLEVLQAHGLEPFDSVGLPFDPERMRALGQGSGSSAAPPGQVVEEALRGYLWQRSLLREAQVLVAGPWGP